jgi:hypothetical protein
VVKLSLSSRCRAVVLLECREDTAALTAPPCRHRESAFAGHEKFKENTIASGSIRRKVRNVEAAFGDGFTDPYRRPGLMLIGSTPVTFRRMLQPAVLSQQDKHFYIGLNHLPTV